MPREQQTHITLDDGQKIVEVVRNTRGQLPYSVHLLRLTQIRLQLQTFGDIMFADERVPLAIKHDGLGGQQRCFFTAIPGANFHFQITDRFSVRELIEHLLALPGIGPKIQIERALRDHLVSRIAGHLQVAGIHVEEAMVFQGLDAHGHRAGVERFCEPLLREAQLFFGLRAFRHLPREPPVGDLEFSHHLIKVLQLCLGLLGKKPFFNQGVRHLEHC